jgi:hypothetical protein
MIWNKISEMRKSRRYIVHTLLCFYGAIFVFVGVNRATESMGFFPEEEIPRTPAEVLASLSDFSSIESSGDFILEIVQAPQYSVDYLPPPDEQGSFEARVENGQLILKGYNNRRENQSGRVRVAMPVLITLTAVMNPQVLISGYQQNGLTLNLRYHGMVILADNTLEQLEINAAFVREISLENTVTSSEALALNGQTRIIR